MNGVPEGVTHISTCPGCHFEKLDYDGGWRWRCDGFHPEVLAQIEEWEERQRRRRADEEEELWRRDL